MPQPTILYDFNFKSQDDWNVENDTVMGGESDGLFEITEEGHGLFSGHVSLANDGGFTSILHTLDETVDVSGNRVFTARVQGDGKKYTFRVRGSEDQEYFHQADFPTTGEWETVTIPFADMKAVHHGEPVDVPNFAGGPVYEIQFLIANGQDEDFEIMLNNFCYGQE